jgi:hypothetical protein
LFRETSSILISSTERAVRHFSPLTAKLNYTGDFVGSLRETASKKGVVPGFL